LAEAETSILRGAVPEASCGEGTLLPPSPLIPVAQQFTGDVELNLNWAVAQLLAAVKIPWSEAVRSVLPIAALIALALTLNTK
jgi:hypothetical protein